MKRSFVTICLLVTACGTAGVGPGLNWTEEDKAQYYATHDPLLLCRDYNATFDPQLKQALTDRGVIPSSEWDLIDHHKVAIGMTQAGVACALGAPADTYSSVSQYGSADVWFYARGLTVRFDNGFVVSVSQ
jgi:hypothetical protein